MVLEKTKINENVGALEGTNFKIDTSNEAVIMNLLSKGFYSDPYGSITREYLSNCWDSHVEGDCENVPIQVRFFNSNGADFISFDDFGVGLSPERVRDIFTVYFKSTKRNSNSEIGGFGLGSKSAYSYTDNFFINTWHNGTLYKYMMTKNELGVSRLEVLGKESSDRKNGTSVFLQLKETGYWRKIEKDKWIDAIKEQTSYFNNLHYDIEGIEATIYEGKYFKYSTLNENSHSHILLGQVPYPDPERKWGMPVAVKFDIGEIQPTPNRESIVLDEKTKRIVKERRELAYDELKAIYDKSRNTDDIKTFYEYKRHKSKIKFKNHDANFPCFNNELPIFNPLPGIEDPLRRFKVKKRIENRLIAYKKELNYSSIFNDNWNILTYSGKLSGKKNKYLAGLGNYYLVHLDDEIINKDTDWLDWEQKYFDSLPSYEDIVVPKTYVPKKRTIVQRENEQLVIHCLKKHIHNPQVGVWRNEYHKLKDLKNFKVKLVYCTIPEKEKIKKYFPLGITTNVLFISGSSFTLKLVKDLGISFKEFMDTKYYKRVITAIRIKKLYNKFKYWNHCIFFQNRFPNFYVKLNKINEYYNKYSIGSSYGNVDSFIESIYKEFEEKDLWDSSVSSEIKYLENHIDTFKILKYLYQDSQTQEMAYKYITKINKYYKG